MIFATLEVMKRLIKYNYVCQRNLSERYVTLADIRRHFQ